MADIELVIKIPEDVYKDIMAHNRESRESGKSAYYFEGLIQNGMPLPKGHGDLIDRNEVCRLEEELCVTECGCCGLDGCFYDRAKTIIEADKSESEQ
jgi:hypothetical protein